MLQVIHRKTHPLTALSSFNEANTIEHEGQTFVVTRLPSRAYTQPEQPREKGALTEKERKALLSQRRKDELNLGRRFNKLSAEKQHQKLTEFVLKHKKENLRKELKVGKVSKHLRKAHPEVWEVSDQDRARMRRHLVLTTTWFDEGLRGEPPVFVC